MTTNEGLQDLLNNSRLICLAKLEAVEAQLPQENSDVEELQTEMKTLFGHFSNPQLWANPISFNQGNIAQMVLDINAINPTNEASFVSKTSSFIQFLRRNVLKNALGRITNTSTNIWNIRMLNALRITLQETSEKREELNIKDSDTDPDKGQTFGALNEHQKELVATFRTLLTSNSIPSDQSKVRNMTSRGTNIKNASSVKIFFKLFRKLSESIEKQTAGATMVPMFANVPSADNQASLNALSVALVKVDKQAATLSAGGVNWDNNSDFKKLTSRRKDEVTAYQKALNTNAANSNATITGEIEQAGNSAHTAADESTFLAAYKKLIDLVKTNTPATA